MCNIGAYTEVTFMREYFALSYYVYRIEAETKWLPSFDDNFSCILFNDNGRILFNI